MSRRVILTRVASGEYDGFEQDTAVVLVDAARGKQLLDRLARSKRIKAEDDGGLYAVEYWTDAVHFVQHDELADLIRERHTADHDEAGRVADLIEAFYGSDAALLRVDDPEQCVYAVIDDYAVDGETRLSCVTAVVTEDAVVFTALAKYGGGRIESKTLDETHVRWLAGPPPA